MRSMLDTAYRAAGWIAALALFIIFALVAVQVLARLLDGTLKLLGQPVVGFIIPSIAEICGFLLAAASFLALAHTLTVGGHIRVGVLIERLPAGVRRIVEGAVGLAAAGLGVYMTVAMARLTWKSWAFNDVSYGFIPVPLALPQAAMTLGLALLTIAILDVTIRAWRTRVFVEAGSEV